MIWSIRRDLRRLPKRLGKIKSLFMAWLQGDVPFDVEKTVADVADY
jgi:hypothetical protein